VSSTATKAPKQPRKPKQRKPPKRRTLNWEIDDVEVPRVGGPDADLLLRRQRRYRKLVWSSMIMAPIALLAVVISLGKTTPAPTVSTTAGAATSPGRTVATQELETWLAETPSPLPGAQVLSWDGAKVLHPPAAKVAKGLSSGTGKPRWTTEEDTFTLIVPPPAPKTHSAAQSTSKPLTTATIYQATVAVALKPGGGAVALSGPSITLVPPTKPGAWDADGPWPGLDITSSVTGAVQQAINGWADAYTSGSSSKLALAVGDTDSSHHYVALSGVRSVTVTVLASSPRSAPNGPVVAKQTPTAEIVEVALDINWSAEPAPSSSSASNFTTSLPKTTMDLLVERANTSAPVVVAWGPAGSGPTLHPYQNGTE